jgi:hypothetical protein
MLDALAPRGPGCDNRDHRSNTKLFLTARACPLVMLFLARSPTIALDD